MNKSKLQEIEQRIKKLQQDYFKSLPAKIESISELRHQADQENWQGEHTRSLHHACHSLGGSGATFGANEISELALAIENTVVSFLDETRPPTEDEIKSIDGLIEQLKQQLVNVVDVQTWFDLPRVDPEKETGKLIYIIEDELPVAEKLASVLCKENFQVEIFSRFDNFKTAYAKKKPAAVIVDMMFPEGGEAGAGVMHEVRHIYNPAPPVIFVSVRNDMSSRLAAVKAGAARYFTKPVNFEKLTQTLNGLTRRRPLQPYRVFIIDDDETLAEYYATLLQSAGMETETISDPFLTLDKLSENPPDLLLVDVYMPRCSGLDLAAIIRQDDSYAMIPIVFLSNETDLDKQLNAMNLGGDDFFTKPVLPTHLISAITARVKRSRWLTRLRNELEIALDENKQQRTELEKKEERLRYSQLFANIGTWDLNIKSKEMFWSEKVGPLLGYEDTAEVNYEAFLDAIHPEDRSSVMNAIEGCIQSDQPCEVEHRVLWGNGSVHWILQRGDVVRDTAGQARRMLGVLQETTQRKQLERDLATQKEFAVQANRAKSEFLSRMSHELRTPLNAIIGFAQLLELNDEHALTEYQLDNLSEILKAGNHLLELIDEVLDLARIESGKMQLNIEEILVMDTMLEGYSMMMPMAESYDVQLEFNIESCEKTLVNTDRTKMKQVMFNLMSNAIKYNNAGGKVVVSCECIEASRVRISIADTGNGIPVDRQEELFQAFNRLGAEASDIQGTGIGLMITKRLIEMMGGELGFTSKPGRGSRFWFDLASSEIQLSNSSHTPRNNNTST